MQLNKEQRLWRFVDCSCIERETTRLRNLIGRGHLCVAAEEKRKIVMDLWVAAG